MDKHFLSLYVCHICCSPMGHSKSHDQVQNQGGGRGTSTSMDMSKESGVIPTTSVQGVACQRRVLLCAYMGICGFSPEEVL